MCLVTVYVDDQDEQKEVMKDVAQMEAKDDGFLLIGLLGEQRFVRAKIKSLDFIDKRSVVLQSMRKDDSWVEDRKGYPW
jgi:predicted RNA-binding protein